MSQATAPKALALFDSIDTPECRSVITALFNGRPTFPVADTDQSELTRYVRAWVESGALSAERLSLECAKVIAQRFAPQPVAVPAAPLPAPAPVAVVESAPFTAQQWAALAPATGPQTPSVVSEPLPEPEVAPKRRKSAAPVALIEPAEPAPADVRAMARDGIPRRVLARSLFEDCPPEIINAIPAELSVMFYADPAAPVVSSLYAFDPVSLPAALMSVACAPTERFWCFGPRGSGKSEFVRQIAARLARRYYRVSCHRATESSDLLGDVGLRDGATSWVDGPVSQAIRTPGAVLLIDEISYMPTSHGAALNPVLERDGEPLRLPKTGEVLTPAADIIVAVCDNTNGTGTTSAETVGRVQLSADILDRFQKFLPFEYLPVDTERRVLRSMVQAYCGTKPANGLAKKVCKVMATARAKADSGELEGAPSLRRAAAFCTAIVQGMDPSRAYVLTVVNAAPADSQEALRQVFAATWDHDAPAVDPDNPFAPFTTEASA